MIHDTHHPTLTGHVALAEAVLRELARRQAIGSSYAGEAGPLDPALCAAHFGMDAEKWATLCERTAEHFRRVAGYRYDSTQRMEKFRRYTDAAGLIRSGTPPERTGIPGVGLPSRPLQSVLHDLDLPVLEQDRGSPAQEPHGGHEVIAVGAPDHFAGQAGEWAVHDAHRGADGKSRLLGDEEARSDHRVDLAKVAVQHILVDDIEDLHDAIAAQGDQSIDRRAPQEHVAGKRGQPTGSGGPGECGSLFWPGADSRQLRLSVARERSPFPGAAWCAGTTRAYQSRHCEPTNNGSPKGRLGSNRAQAKEWASCRLKLGSAAAPAAKAAPGRFQAEGLCPSGNYANSRPSAR